MQAVAWQRHYDTDCRRCPEDRQELELPSRCHECSFPGIYLANAAAWEVLQVTGAALFDGMGGINLTNAERVAAGLGYSWDKEMVSKISRTAAVMALDKKKIPELLDELESEREADGGE